MMTNALTLDLDNTWGDADEVLAQGPRTESDIPTVPAPRQTEAETARILLRAYRLESARLTCLAATLKEMGIDPNAAWHPGVPDAPSEQP